jgi:hypothetical protein
MAPRHLEMKFWQAGQDYLDAVERLGLRPRGLFWADDEILNSKVLVMVTEVTDIAGPLALAELLFKAYNSEATPQEIDPFIVRLHSPQQSIIREMGKFWPFDVTMHNERGEDITETMLRANIKIGSLNLDPSWVYRFDTRAVPAVEAERQWRRFERNVSALAA